MNFPDQMPTRDVAMGRLDLQNGKLVRKGLGCCGDTAQGPASRLSVIALMQVAEVCAETVESLRGRLRWSHRVFFHDTITDPNEIILTEQQKNHRSHSATSRFGLLFRF